MSRACFAKANATIERAGGRILTMSEEATELLKRALTLPSEERAELASSLMDSLDVVQDEDVEAAWQEEITRRIEDLRIGRAKTVSWTEVRKKARVLTARS